MIKPATTTAVRIIHQNRSRINKALNKIIIGRIQQTLTESLQKHRDVVGGAPHHDAIAGSHKPRSHLL